MQIEKLVETLPPEHGRRFREVYLATIALYGIPPRHISAPGGDYRASYRVHVGDETVIATSRAEYRRTHIEAFILQRIGSTNSPTPKFLGLIGNVLFQSDVGSKRLNVAMLESTPDRQIELAANAVTSLFRVHHAGNCPVILSSVPPIGASQSWAIRLADSVRQLQSRGGRIAPGYDQHAIIDALKIPSQLCFVKWDCRTGNAALSNSNCLSWFDFEFCGLRHGAEDFSWLIADETLPVAPDVMYEIIKDSRIEKSGLSRDVWLDYLSIYTVFHASKRLLLVLDGAEKRGWKEKRKVIARDDVGLHPDFVKQLCSVARFFADRTPLTSPLIPVFDAVEKSVSAES
jgi:hypothetical protein